ncbi:hypothetical protein [Pseudomonas bubulae]|uniref:hypothetical protein n=1 Tax=Pseudomonas bubulae TaxID=2316085 RepID=UPI0030AE0B4F
MLAPSDEFSWLFEGLPTYTTLHQKGMRLYDLGAFEHARQFLQLPATVGDAEAQFALASIIEHSPTEISSQITTLRRQIAGITQISRQKEHHWHLVTQASQMIERLQITLKAQYMPLYEAAAEHGNIDAMLRLGGDAWNAKVRAQLESGLRVHTPEALLDMYALTRDLNWLKHSAASGHAIAQYLLATLYDKNPTMLASTEDPQEVIYELISSSAYGGYPPAMNWFANRIENRRNFALIQHWILKEAQAGSINAVQQYGLALTGMNSDGTHNDTVSGFEADYTGGYALLWLVNQVKGRGSNPYNIQDKLHHLESELGPAQVITAKEIAHEWREHYPLLSEFRLRACLL